MQIFKNIGPKLLFHTIYLMWFISCMPSFAEPVDGNIKTTPQGIHLNSETRLRVVSYNGYWTSIFPKDNGETRKSERIDGKGMDGEARLRRFAEWAPKAKADIWAMQEIIYSKEDKVDTTAKGIGLYFQKITGQAWHVAADNKGRLILSRYPILWSGDVKNARGMAALIDLPASLGSDLLIINLHFYTKPPEVQVKQATNALDFIEAVRRGDHSEIPKQAPIMICGDFNSTPDERPFNILTKLDRDAKVGDGKLSHYYDLKPRQLMTEEKGTYGKVSWSGEVGKSKPEPPTRTIDYVLAPKGFMEVQQSFVFNSLILPEKALNLYSVKREAILLHREDNDEKIDHLPVFLDLK